jgi:hypothetical protein
MTVRHKLSPFLCSQLTLLSREPLEPGISAGVSMHGNLALSAWGSEQAFCPSAAPVPIPRGGRRRVPVHPLLHPSRATDVQQWQHRVGDEPPPYEREMSPAVSETGLSTAGFFTAAMRGGSEVPDVKVITHDEPIASGGYLTTVVEQGPDDELAD